MLVAEPQIVIAAQATVEEAMIFSAKLRLPADVTADVLSDFVNEIMEVVELTPLRNALVGLPGAQIPAACHLWQPLRLPITPAS